MESREVYALFVIPEESAGRGVGGQVSETRVNGMPASPIRIRGGGECVCLSGVTADGKPSILR